MLSGKDKMRVAVCVWRPPAHRIYLLCCSLNDELSGKWPGWNFPHGDRGQWRWLWSWFTLMWTKYIKAKSMFMQLCQRRADNLSLPLLGDMMHIERYSSHTCFDISLEELLFILIFIIRLDMTYIKTKPTDGRDSWKSNWSPKSLELILWKPWMSGPNLCQSIQ